MELVHWENRPTLRRPLFVIAFEGWNDAGDAATLALDYLAQEWAYKPVGLVTYGGMSGGMRAAHSIRQVVSVLKMIPVPEAVALPMVFPQIVNGEFVPTDGNLAAANVMLDEIVRLRPATEVS